MKIVPQEANLDTLEETHGSLLNLGDEGSWASSIGHSWAVFIILQWGHKSTAMHFTECN